jgi:hypothetical protein
VRRKLSLSYFLVLGLVIGQMWQMGQIRALDDFELRKSLFERNREHSTYFRMGELRYFSNDVVKYEVRPGFYFCGEFCPVKIVPSSLQTEKKSLILK